MEDWKRTHLYLLPFTNIDDLRESCRKMVEEEEKRTNLVMKVLDENKVPYDKLPEWGVAIDINLVPKDIDIVEVLAPNSDGTKKLFNELGVVKNPEYTGAYYL